MEVKKDNSNTAGSIPNYRPASLTGLTSSTKCLTPYLTTCYNSRTLEFDEVKLK